MKFLFLLLVITYFQGFSQTGSEDGKYKILTYGMARNPSSQELTVNQKWNIQKVSVAECRITSKLRDSVKTENERTWEKIARDRQIENPEMEYQKDLYKTRRDLNKIKAIVHNSDYSNSIWKNLRKKEKDFLIYENLKYLDKSKYAISIKKWKRKNDGKPQNGTYNLIVDLSSESVILKD